MDGTQPYNFLQTGLTRLTPQVGDTYAIETLFSITLGIFNIQGEGASNFIVGPSFFSNQVIIGELYVSTSGVTGPAFLSNTNCILGTYSCRWAYLRIGMLGGAQFYSDADCFGDDGQGTGGVIDIRSGVVQISGACVTNGATGTWSMITAMPGTGIVYLDYDTCVIKGQIQGTNIKINSAQVWDTPSNGNTVGGHAVYIGAISQGNSSDLGMPGYSMELGRYIDGTGIVRLWGAGAAGAGVYVCAGGQFGYRSGSPPTITGTAGANHFRLANSTSSPGFNATTNVYGTSVANTWANLVAAGFTTGMGGSAHNPQSNAHILLMT